IYLFQAYDQEAHMLLLAYMYMLPFASHYQIHPLPYEAFYPELTHISKNHNLAIPINQSKHLSVYVTPATVHYITGYYIRRLDTTHSIFLLPILL
ncbi:hypothetical protein ACJX0J_018995, partial [Zea mays]